MEKKDVVKPQDSLLFNRKPSSETTRIEDTGVGNRKLYHYVPQYSMLIVTPEPNHDLTSLLTIDILKRSFQIGEVEFANEGVTSIENGMEKKNYNKTWRRKNGGEFSFQNGCMPLWLFSDAKRKSLGK